jgi:hypothetical protein
MRVLNESPVSIGEIGWYRGSFKSRPFGRGFLLYKGGKENV